MVGTWSRRAVVMAMAVAPLMGGGVLASASAAGTISGYTIVTNVPDVTTVAVSASSMTGTVGVANGGTGAASAASARGNPGEGKKKSRGMSLHVCSLSKPGSSGPPNGPQAQPRTRGACRVPKGFQARGWLTTGAESGATPVAPAAWAGCI